MVIAFSVPKSGINLALLGPLVPLRLTAKYIWAVQSNEQYGM